MLLCKTGNHDTLSEHQKHLFRSLFGDFATENYKHKEKEELRKQNDSMDFGVL